MKGAGAARVLDVRGLACPLPAVRARVALRTLAPDAELVVLATDPEAPVDVAAVAADAGRACAVTRDGDAWRIVLSRR